MNSFLPVCVQVCTRRLKELERALEPLEMALQVVVSGCAGSGNLNQVPLQEQQVLLTVRHLSSSLLPPIPHIHYPLLSPVMVECLASGTTLTETETLPLIPARALEFNIYLFEISLFGAGVRWLSG